MTAPDTPAPKSAILDLCGTIVLALLIALVVRVVVFQPYTIPSGSMEPALVRGDYIVVSKFDYGWSRHSIPLSPPLFPGRLLGRAPERGDVVVFKLPRDDKTDYIKRLVGLPGDLVQVRSGTVFVNGQAIPTTALEPARDPDAPGLAVMQRRETLAGGRSYLTWDRGPGQAGDDTPIYRVPAGHYFFMGDNRDNSSDSRWPAGIGVGFVPADNLVGKAQLILFSWSRDASPLKPWTWFLPRRFLRRI